jgi:acyl-coenzyme A thioesterase PaaI-like protein
VQANNKFSRIVNKINRAPASLRPWLLSKVFNSQVKFAATSGIKVEALEQFTARVSLANRKKIQNHIGGVHAVAAALLAESSSGIIFGFHLPQGKLPLLKSMTIDYQRRMQGSLKAIASISKEQINLLHSQERGDMLVEVIITDESGEQPITCTMNWAWITKK